MVRYFPTNLYKDDKSEIGIGSSDLRLEKLREAVDDLSTNKDIVGILFLEGAETGITTWGILNEGQLLHETRYLQRGAPMKYLLIVREIICIAVS